MFWSSTGWFSPLIILLLRDAEEHDDKNSIWLKEADLSTLNVDKEVDFEQEQIESNNNPISARRWKRLRRCWRRNRTRKIKRWDLYSSIYIYIFGIHWCWKFINVWGNLSCRDQRLLPINMGREKPQPLRYFQNKCFSFVDVYIGVLTRCSAKQRQKLMLQEALALRIFI